MAHLRHCFRCLEILADIGAPIGVWKRETGRLFRCVEPLLVPTDRRASTVPAPRAGYPAMHVVEFPDGRTVAVCPTELSPRREVSRDELVHHRIEERRLRSIFGSALGITIDEAPAARFPGMLSMGICQPHPAVVVPVVAAVASGAGHLLQLVGDSAIGCGTRGLLLTPTRDHWSTALPSLVARSGSVIASLDEVLDWRAGRWTATAAWQSTLEALEQRPSEVVPIMPARPQREVDVDITRLKEMERCVLQALLEKRAIGKDSRTQPDQRELAALTGYSWDASFKSATSTLVKMGLLDNGRHHGRRGGYFLTEQGQAAAEILSKS